MIIIYKEIKDGKIEFTKKELEELLGKVRKEGYDEGYSKGYSDAVHPITYPTTPTTPVSPTYPTSPTTPISPTYPYITWGTSETSSSDVLLKNVKTELANNINTKTC